MQHLIAKQFAVLQLLFSAAALIQLPCTYRVAQNKIPHQKVCNISATSGLISKILEAA